jgi:hypothetical protein
MIYGGGMKFFVSIVIILAALQPLRAQSQLQNHSSIGFLFYYSMNSHEASFKGLPDIPSCCPEYNDGTGRGYSLGLLYEMPLSREFRIETHLLYSDISADFESTEGLIININNEPYEGRFKHLIEADLRALAIELLFAYNPFAGLTISVGPGMSTLLVKDFHQSESIVDPEYGVFYPEGTRTRNEVFGEIPNSSTAIISGIAEIRYSILLDRNDEFSLNPTINYVYTFNDIVDNLLWKPHAFRVGLSIRTLL